MEYDLRYVRLDEFLDFIFDRPVAAQHREENWGRAVPREPRWFDSVELELDVDPIRNCEYFVLAFCDAGALAQRYTRSQLEQGFHWMQASHADGSVADILRADIIPVACRAAMVRSMASLFSDLFAADPLHSAPYLWWQNINRSIFSATFGARSEEERLRLRRAIIATLGEILTLDAPTCRSAALQGVALLPFADPARDTEDRRTRRAEVQARYRRCV